MRILVIAVVLALSVTTYADNDEPSAGQRAASAAVTLEIDPDVIVMDIDEAKKITDDMTPPVQPNVLVQTESVPTPPETRVIELKPQTIKIVNRTNHFRIVSRRPAEKPVAAADPAEEGAEE